jgi:hypothetical protein
MGRRFRTLRLVVKWLRLQQRLRPVFFPRGELTNLLGRLEYRPFRQYIFREKVWRDSSKE